MRQVFQDPRAGTVEVHEVPEPAARSGALVVRNHRSVVSPGTDRSTVLAARSSYLRTARNRPDLVRQVVDRIRRHGVIDAYRAVQSKLSQRQALGYASAGTVVAVGDGVDGRFAVGDRVACMGQGHASHAEVVCVPASLAARVPEGVPLEHAAFGTLGAIALHAVRQAAPGLGDTVAVIGLGVLGQLVAQLATAHGARVIGFDLDAGRVAHATALGAEAGHAGGTDDQVATALAWTRGVGVDIAIVAAASRSPDPMVAASGMCRERGRVVALGVVPFGLPREVAYAKELELRIARSYGPGRYDRDFEDKGVAWPVGWVPWTQTRNLEAFLGAIGSGRVQIAPLISHRFALAQAAAAYDLLVADGEAPLGLVITYPATARPPVRTVRLGAARSVSGHVRLGFVGAGSFARATLLPAFARHPDVHLHTVVARSGLSAWDAAQTFGFDHASTDVEALLGDPTVDLVAIATRHDSHADLASLALEAGKHVFVEKPLALTEAELARVLLAAASSEGLLLVGFNRRFAPMTGALRDIIASRGPAALSVRVNAGALGDHWLNDPAVGGGRMIGEGCHFVDLLSALTGDAAIVDVAARTPDRRVPPEDYAVQLAFSDGSVGQLLYTARGDPAAGKERIEAFCGGTAAVIDDWTSGRVVSGGRSRSLGGRGKGHPEEIAALVAAVRAGGPSPIALETLEAVTRTTFEVHRALGA